jgi:hypothetical protein
MAALRAGNQQNSIAACASYLVLIAATGELKVSRGNTFAGATFCFFRELWQKCPFRDISVAEDKLFLKDHEPMRIGIRNPELYCYVRHAEGHAWSFFLRSEEKEQGPVAAGDDVTEYLRKLPAYSKSLQEYVPAEDLLFYESQVQDGSKIRLCD